MKRPKNAAANTAFTVVSDPGYGTDPVVRISMDPSALDCEPMGEGPPLEGAVAYDYLIPMDEAGFLRSCRSTARPRPCLTAQELGAYLEQK